jgi:uncharacterized phiE125 gp8 family phage protein
VSAIFREINSSLRPSGSAAEWPITLQDAKDVLDFGTTTADDDRRIMALIPAAIAAVEVDAQRAIANQTWILRMDEFPCDEIELRKPPVNAVSSVVYLDTDGSSTTLSTDDYQVDLVSPDGLVMLYSAGPSVNGSGALIGYAVSQDGIEWERVPESVFDFTAVSGSRSIWFTEFLYRNGVYYLFFELGKGNNTEIYLATHEGLLINEGG